MPKIPVYHPPKHPTSSAPKPKATSSSSSSSSGSIGHSSGTSSHSSSGHSSGGGGKGGGHKGGHKAKGGGKTTYLHDGEKPGKKGKGDKGYGKTPEGKATNKYMTQAKNMQGQIEALKYALGNKGFRAALAVRLRNINLVSAQQDATLVEGYNTRLGSLKDTAADNEKAAGDASAANVTNRARERSNAVNEALNNGAGESDVLRSQMMSLRSWDANQGEINRSYFDSLHSLNSSVTDLNADTKTARANMASQANADRDQVMTQYYDQRSETLTNLGNAQGMQAEIYGNAVEMKGGKKAKGLQTKASKASAGSFMDAAKESGKVWKNPGVPKALMDWKGAGNFEEQTSNSLIQAAPAAAPSKKPEGASLRKWTV